MNKKEEYLENFKILTDTVTINDGYIVNFGVIFDVTHIRSSEWYRTYY